LIGQRPTSLDLFLAGLAARLSGTRDPSKVFNRTRLREPDPLADIALVYALAAAWVMLMVFVELGWIALSGAMDGLDLEGHGITLPVYCFIAAFCLTAVCDQVWRAVLLDQARRRYYRGGEVLDQAGHRLLRFARLNDWTLLLQLGAGFAFAIWLG